MMPIGVCCTPISGVRVGYIPGYLVRTSTLIISLDAYGGIAHTNLRALILREPSGHKLGRDSSVRYVVRWVVQIYLQRPTSHLDEVAKRRCPW